jgi:tripartite-type tricarboxylate transporter receptor subunit TctC
MRLSSVLQKKPKGERMKTNKLSLHVFISVLALFFVIAVFGVQPVRSEYPEQPITILVGMAAGGTTDLLTRAMAPTLSAILGKPVVIENKDGGGGSVAAGLVANAKPDGYTLAVVQNVSIVDTPLMQKVTYKPLASFTPVAVVAASDHSSLLVKSDSPWKTFKDFIDYAKNNPGKIKYSSAGVGSGMHIAMETIAHKDGIKWVHIPYKGSAPARVALLGGHVDANSSGVDWPPFVQSGQLRVLATHGEKRSPYFPDTPCLKELGYGFVSETVHAVIGPAGLPQDVVKKLEAAFKKGTESPDFKKVVTQLYLTDRYMDSKQFGQHLNEKWPRTEKLFKELGIITEAATKPY